MLCSICIATFKRPQLLDNLLESLVMQRLPENVGLEIIVVDNDPEQSGKDIVSKYSNTSHLHVYYYTQPVKNISITRNRAVEKTQGNYILFIDDDEVATQNWVILLLKTLEACEADGVFGPVVPKYNETTPTWIRKGPFFEETCIKKETGSEATSFWTGNCLVKASLLKALPGPFSIEFGLTGGEDTFLFEKLKARSAKFVYNAEAVVYEYVPPQRTNLTYLLKRSLRSGNAHTRRALNNTAKNKIMLRLFMLLKAICYGCIGMLLMILLFPVKIYRYYWLTKVYSNIGRFLAVFDYFPKDYK